MTKEQIILLIERMNTVENVRESSDSISWKAHREAETLAAPLLYPLLQEIIYANASLGRTGELSDIPLLEKHILSRSRDIKISAQFAIDRIRERKQ